MIKVVEQKDKKYFELNVNHLVSIGYTISSTSIGTDGVYRAILIQEENK